MTSMPNSTTVLIVGAGPSGLVAALSLLHHGYKDFVIVDAVEQGENTSRALVVHAATLEVCQCITTLGRDTYLFRLGTGHHRLRGRNRSERNQGLGPQYLQPLLKARFRQPLVSRQIHPSPVYPRHPTECYRVCSQREIQRLWRDSSPAMQSRFLEEERE